MLVALLEARPRAAQPRKASIAQARALPAEMRRELWTLPDPAAVEGTDEEIDAAFREVRDTLMRRFEVLTSRAPSVPPR